MHTGFGIPDRAAFGVLDLAELGNESLILEQAALVTLGIALVGLALPVGYASGNWRLLVVLLGILMALMWIVSGLLVYLILGLLFRVSVTGDTKNVGNAS